MKIQTREESAVKERLLSAALKLFTERGFAATTVREIVERAGVTKPVLYYYFQNKEGIYLEIMNRPFAEFVSLVEEGTRGEGSAVERIFRFCDLVFTLFVANIDVARLMYSIYYGPPQGAPYFDFDAHHQAMQGVVRTLVEEGIAAGDIRGGDSQDIMWAIVGALNVAMEEQLCKAAPALDRQGLQRILRLIFRGIGEDGR